MMMKYNGSINPRQQHQLFKSQYIAYILGLSLFVIGAIIQEKQIMNIFTKHTSDVTVAGIDGITDVSKNLQLQQQSSRQTTLEATGRTTLKSNDSKLTTKVKRWEENSKKESKESKKIVPLQCTERELKVVRQQLPPEQCLETQTNPELNKCSFNWATRCPDAIWLQEYYKEINNNSKRYNPQEERVGIVFGCNKAIDAVNTLRMLSQNDTYNHKIWYEALTNNSVRKAPGVCGAEKAEPFPLLSKNVYENTVVHCIEALPVNAQRLMSTAEDLHWSDSKQFVIYKAAISNQDGTILFPSINSTFGEEGHSIDDCISKPGICEEVPMYRLDTLLQQYAVNESTPLIDILSIDVEGFDYEAMLGAPLILQNTKYMEFEYHYVGNWKKYPLSVVIDTLYNEHNFICYWAGMDRHIWRITNCYMDHYDTHFWSNVACVNTIHAKELYYRMEDMYQVTLKSGKSIQYNRPLPLPKDVKI